MREFVPVDEDSNEMYPPCECSICGYVFSSSKDEKTGLTRPTVSLEARNRARERMRQETLAHLTASGVRLENLNGYRPY